MGPSFFHGRDPGRRVPSSKQHPLLRFVMPRRSLLFALILALLAGPLPAALLVDGFAGGTLVNDLGGSWATYTDGFSTVGLDPAFSPGYNAAPHCLKIDFQFITGASPTFCGSFTGLNPALAPRDVSAYAGLRFWVQGTGSWQVAVATSATESTYNHYAAGFTAPTAWNLVEVPFSSLKQFWGAATAWDPA